jgi:hypothetical protein
VGLKVLIGVQSGSTTSAGTIDFLMTKLFGSRFPEKSEKGWDGMGNSTN